jgi:hypothetical protein
MKKILTPWFGIILVFIFTSCKNEWFDLKSDSTLVVPSSLKDFQALLDNDLFNGNGVALGEIASDGHYITDAVFQTRGNTERNAYTWSNGLPYENVGDWISSSASLGGAYRVVYYSNLILDGMNKLSPSDLTYKNVKGQALFHRARCFYAVSQVWAPPYLEGSPNSEYGIPLRLEADINILSVRSTIQQTYGRVIDDLTSAAALLPVKPLYKTRASKPAAFGLLARVYLSMENYKMAGLYADSCLQLYNTLIDFNSKSVTSTLPFEIFNPEVIFHERMTNYSLLGRASLLIDSSLYSLYAANDLRLSLFFIKNNTTGNVTYKGSYSGTSALLFCGISTSELYLIRSECSAREGKVAEAIKDLNRLLVTRWKTGLFVPKSASSVEEALIAILNERKKELLCRGLRWTDLRRLNRDPRFTVTLTRTISDKTYILEPGSHQYTFPIPDDVIQISRISQNPGW